MSRIHPTAVIEDGARLGQDVEVGPYSLIGKDVTLGDGVVLGGHAVIAGHTAIGARTQVFSFAYIGGPPQDVTYKGEPTRVTIGADCIIREHATVHRGTMRGKQLTSIGAHCFLMVGAHIAHDCVIGDHVTFVNNATVGGHVEVGDYAILGGLAAVHQRIRIGAHAFVGGHSGIGGDLIPFGTATGRGARLAGLNIVGLKRRGFDRASIHALRAAYKILFFGGGPPAHRLEEVAAEFAHIPPVLLVVDFLRKGGSARLCLPAGESDEGSMGNGQDDDAE